MDSAQLPISEDIALNLEWLERQSENTQKVFYELGLLTGDDFYVGFSPVMKRSGLDRPTVRRACRLLARKGLAEYARGLFNDDGMPGGAGYSLTRSGRSLFYHIEDKVPFSP